MGITRRKLFGAGAGLGLVATGQAKLTVTPPEVEGPFYPVVEQADKDFDLTRIEGHDRQAAGEHITVIGQVLDEAGQVIPAVHIEIWQANSHGRYRHPSDESERPLDPHFQGWSVIKTGNSGGFKFKTVMPGIYPVSNSWNRPPHIHFKVSKAGYESLITQMYFAGHELNEVDRLIQSKSPAQQQAMTAILTAEGAYQYNIVLAAL